MVKWGLEWRVFGSLFAGLVYLSQLDSDHTPLITNWIAFAVLAVTVGILFTATLLSFLHMLRAKVCSWGLSRPNEPAIIVLVKVTIFLILYMLHRRNEESTDHQTQPVNNSTPEKTNPDLEAAQSYEDHKAPPPGECI
ncbi:hypothetical protein Ciccas_012137 [Cichlidogyrus casuarinus]|uniref:Uncharacterized protein n=1 Tax=Cichlidogyrus casuarinus TaxID=1844966 RepID=A0ABD2PPA5_9PLAT